MKKSLLKLVSIGLIAVITLVIVVVSSYAWFSMSDSPSLAGLQVKIGGRNTILIAPDVSETVDGQTVHYPGMFSDSMDFSKHSAYSYLNDIVDLSLSSTADGIHWYFPSYSEQEGDMNDVSEFLLDDTLQYANMTELPADDAVSGGYAMLDFWVVSPKNCNLRVSVGDGNGGSFLVSLPQPISDGNGSYKLDVSNASLGACARVGFLANTQKVTDSSMLKYVSTTQYNDKYSYLKGIYQEKGKEWNYYPAQFTIYEPNATYHHEDGVYTLSHDGLSYRVCENGSYVPTNPIGYVDGAAKLVDVLDRTAVQTPAQWQLANDSEYRIEQIFQAYLKGETNLTEEVLADNFYRKYLGYQCGTYLQKGRFIKKTANLTAAADADGVVEKETVAELSKAGASDDIVIAELEKNVPQRIRMFVWIEGQDVDCSKVTSAGGILVNLELAGSTD